MSAEQVALDHYRDQRRLSDAATEVADEAWRRVDADNIAASWSRHSSEVTLVVAGAQRAAAQQADGYLNEVLDAQGLSTRAAGSVLPAAFVGVASDGRPLQSLLQGPAFAALTAIGTGHPVPRALAMGLAALEMIVRTQVVDAGRAADHVALVARPAVGGYVRMLVPPSCSRCAILAGRWYRHSTGFQRHPRCDCRHLPSNEDAAGDLATNPRTYFNSLGRGQQDRIFGNAGAQAIRDGADMSQVVNARRGMFTAGGRQLTRESTSRRGVAPGRPRLMPEEILRQAGGDRDKAIDLLHQYGYLRR